jgi:hypothetical protein
MGITQVGFCYLFRVYPKLGHTVTKQRNRKHFTKKQQQITKQKQETNLQKNRYNIQTKQKQCILKKLGKGLQSA